MRQAMLLTAVAVLAWEIAIEKALAAAAGAVVDVLLRRAT